MYAAKIINYFWEIDKEESYILKSLKQNKKDTGAEGQY